MSRPLPDQSLGVEWAVLELLARGIADEQERQTLRDLVVADGCNWGELLEQALRHKMLPMLAYYVISTDLRFEIPVTIYQHLESALAWNRWQIETLSARDRSGGAGICRPRHPIRGHQRHRI